MGISLLLGFLKLPHVAHAPAPTGDTQRLWHFRYLLLCAALISNFLRPH